MEKGKYGILVGNSSDKLKLEAVLVVSDDTVLEQMDKICPLQEELEQIYLTKEFEKKKSVQRQEKLITAQVPEYYFKPAMIPAKSENAGKNQENLTEEEKRFVSVLEDRTTEELIPLLYGKISENISTLGAAGFEYRDQQVKPAVLWKRMESRLLLWQTVRQESASDSGMR